MSDYRHIIPFIKKAEGGLSKDTADSASANPVPDGSGYHTNKGIVWSTWSNVFGTDADSIKRFYAMSDDDWGLIFKKLYWDMMLGDQIKSQRISDLLVDWIWGSGKHYPEADVQDILIHAFNQHLVEDGNFGAQTIASINSVDEQKLYDDIVAKRFWFFDQCVASHPTNERFLQGWRNRLNNLVAFDKVN
jgi:lysozyme family protein